MKLQIPDMVCGGCVEIITQAIAATDPTAKVTVDLPQKTLDLETQVAPELIEGAIVQAGYTVVKV
jgi:copper chaperone